MSMLHWAVSERVLAMEELVAKVDVGIALGDPYRVHIHGDGEVNTAWRHGSPPSYDLVNAAFEAGRTKVWEEGSLEQVVQNLVKSWEMELTHKSRLEDFKTIDQSKFSLAVNGSCPLSGEQVLKVGSYNALLASVEEHSSNPLYRSSQQTFESSHEIFKDAFPAGFAWEVLEVYSGPPTVAFKWRHWGVASDSGNAVDMVGIVVAKVDDELKIGNLEVYYDPSHFLGKIWGDSSCPFQQRPTNEL